MHHYRYFLKPVSNVFVVWATVSTCIILTVLNLITTIGRSQTDAHFTKIPYESYINDKMCPISWKQFWWKVRHLK